MQKEEVKLDLLREARKNGQQICKIKSNGTEFVKVRRGYSQPDEVRVMYLSAMSELVSSGFATQIFRNDGMELFELTSAGTSCTTTRAAKEKILEELKSNRRVYKVHSLSGEFIQFAKKALNENDDERIVYMKSLHELVYHGLVQVVSENRELATYELALPSSGYVQYHHLSEPSKPRLELIPCDDIAEPEHSQITA